VKGITDKNFVFSTCTATYWRCIIERWRRDIVIRQLVQPV